MDNINPRKLEDARLDRMEQHQQELAKIAAEIDAYNKVCERMATVYKTNFISITESQRIDSSNPEYVASDGLHPSGKEYEKWATKLAEMINVVLK